MNWCWSIYARLQQILNAGWCVWLSRGYGLTGNTALPLLVLDPSHRTTACADAGKIADAVWTVADRAIAVDHGTVAEAYLIADKLRC